MTNHFLQQTHKRDNNEDKHIIIQTKRWTNEKNNQTDKHTNTQTKQHTTHNTNNMTNKLEDTKDKQPNKTCYKINNTTTNLNINKQTYNL